MSLSNKNICIVTYSLGLGGAERVAAQQTKMLSNLGYNVFIVSVINDINQDYSGELLNLGVLKSDRKSVFNKFNRLSVLKKFLSDNNIDLIIDHRSRNFFLREFMLKHLLYKKNKTIFVVHSHNLSKSFPNNKLLSRCLYTNKSTLVSVSKSIEKEVIKEYRLNNISTIYNAIDLNFFDDDFQMCENESYILFFGRFDEHAKDLTFLIRAYEQSILPSKNIKLHLLGDGEDKNKLINFVESLNLTEYVLFKPYTNNPYPIVKRAMFTVLTSNYEGFPMSIIESLACETPVVSVDCKSGPKEVITNKYNGLLVTKNIDIYTEALNLMIFDTKLLADCKSNCLSSIKHLDIHIIKKQWRSLIETL